MLGLAYDGGAYDVVVRHALAVAVWWTIAWLVLLRLAPRERFSGWGLVSCGLLAAFVLFSGLSIIWADSAERAFLAFDRGGLYLGVFLLVYLLARVEDAPVWCDGLAIGISAVCGLALFSRLFPGHLSHPALVEGLPGAAARLTYPVDYWNGLGILLALGFPLLFRAATAGRSPLARGVALVPAPAITAAIYLTSSRGAVGAALIGTLTFLVLTGRRWQAAVAVVTAAAGSAGALAVLANRDTLVDGPLGSAAAASQGHSAAAWIAVSCLATGAAFAGLTWSPPRLRIPAAVGWGVVVLTAAAVLVALIAVHPIRRFEEFKQPPGRYAQKNFTSAHLLSGRGNGRWQFWSASVDEFRTRPLVGRGAGSWEAWWAQHQSFPYFTRYAHSVYLGTLGELGLIGLVLLVSAFLAAFIGAVVAARRAPPDGRTALAGAGGAFAAYAVAAGIDWMWEVTIVSVVAFACLGLLARFASARGPRVSVTGNVRLVTAVAGLVVPLIVFAEAVPMLTELRLRTSQSAALRGDTAAARDAALEAHDLEPWAASPYLQLALIYEQGGRLGAARRAIDAATERDAADWRLWLVAARVAAEQGDARAARERLRRARELNPRSPIFSASAQ